MKKAVEFQEFLKGDANELPFATFSYKGYSLWNISKDTLVSDSGLGYLADVLGDHFGYRDYYNLNLGWLYEKEDTDYFVRLSPESLLRNFKNGVIPPAHIFTFVSEAGQICIKITPAVMRSPNGDIFLKLQAENVTDRVIYENMLEASAKMSEFVARIDGNAEMVYFLNTLSAKNYKKVSLVPLLTMFSAALGEELDCPKALFEFIEGKCGKDSSATIINRFADDSIKSIHLEIVNREDKQYFISGADVTSLVRMEVNSYYDMLTGLPNMDALRLIMQPTVKKMRSDGMTPALIYFDIRDMKAINEKYSFEQGNGILKGTAYTLRNVFAGCPVVRLAEDHFAVLTDKTGMEQRIEQVYQQVFNNPSGIPVQICAGIYIDNGQSLDTAAICDRARLACKSLKGDYSSRYKIFEHNILANYHQRRHILNRFEEALEKEYIKVYYHPIARTLNGHICDMEALSRWFDPEKGRLQPAQFIAVLEEHRLIHKLDFYMIQKICENLDRQRSENLPLVPVSVNLSRIDFEMFDMVDEVLRIVDSYRIPHKLLTIEITESAFIHNRQFLKSQIDRFRTAGFDVWMDDFGSEFSSLNTLHEFTFDLVKLDMNFMMNFSPKGKNRSILPDIITMLLKQGMHTLTEGVQTKDQLHFLRDIGCEKAQGYLFSRPMPCEHFMDPSSKTGLTYDDFRISEYYDKIGMVRLDNSLITEYRIHLKHQMLGIPSAIIEYRQGRFRILKANPLYKQFLAVLGLQEYCTDGEYTEWERQPSREFARAAIKCLVTHSSEIITNDIENGWKVSAQLVCLSYSFSADIGAFVTVVEKYNK